LRVERSRAGLAERSIEPFGVGTVGVTRDRDQADAGLVRREDGAPVRRVLDEQGLARLRSARKTDVSALWLPGTMTVSLRVVPAGVPL
jgi:hypothetical protein